MADRIEDGDLPLGFRVPCADCKWLERLDATKAGHPYRCGYPVEKIALPFGRVISSGLGHSGSEVTFTRKAIEGPIADDARRIGCAMLSARQKGGA
jgi:hypothetical protein